MAECTMSQGKSSSITLFVDPSCPFAWISSQWLKEVQKETGAPYRLRLLSLSVVNQGRDIDQWYRQFNDRAWGPARVGAAVLSQYGQEAFRRFYEAVGMRIHIGGRDAGEEVLTESLAAGNMDRTMATAADDDSWDHQLKELTAAAVGPVNEDVGTPIIHAPEGAFFGPVLTSIPRGRDAVEIYEAVRALARHDSFVEYKRGRNGAVMTE